MFFLSRVRVDANPLPSLIFIFKKEGGKLKSEASKMEHKNEKKIERTA